MSVSRERILWMDRARCLAIMAVVLCHVTENIFTFSLESVQSASVQSNVCGFLFFSVGRLGVPFFLFISGYLLLGRQYDTKDCLTFWKKNLLSLLLTAEIWIVLYNIFLAWFNNTPFSVRDLLCNMFFLRNVRLSHSWYLPMILSVYLFLPLLSNMLQMFDRKIWTVLVSVSFLYLCVAPLITICYQLTFGESISASLDLEFLGGYYGLYLILGYYTRKGTFDRVRTWTLWLVGIASFCCVVLMQLLFYHYNYAYSLWYNCPFLMISALCFFILVSRTSGVAFMRCTRSISSHSFAIYLIHNPVVMLLLRYTKINDSLLLKPVKVLLLFTAAFIVSQAAGILLGKIPGIGTVLTRKR